MSGKQIIKGLEEAVAVARGEAPAARITINGHSYVPEAALLQARREERERAARVADGTWPEGVILPRELWDPDSPYAEARRDAAVAIRAFLALPDQPIPDTEPGNGR